MTNTTIERLLGAIQSEEGLLGAIQSFRGLTGGRNCDAATDEAPIDQAVRDRAYILWEEAGRPESDGVEFWLQAEREFQGS